MHAIVTHVKKQVNILEPIYVQNDLVYVIFDNIRNHRMLLVVSSMFDLSYENGTHCSAMVSRKKLSQIDDNCQRRNGRTKYC